MGLAHGHYQPWPIPAAYRVFLPKSHPDANSGNEINKAKLEGEFLGKLKGKIESASTIIRVKFGAQILTPQIVNQLEQLNEQQLDDFIVGMFNWQQQEMESCLCGVEKV